MAKILLLNGPNLNLLGSREPGHYGLATLKDINERLKSIAEQHQHQLSCFQSNAEHELVDRVQAAAKEKTAIIILNPAAFTHSSIALRDALSATAIPFIEIHLSNIHNREEFRSHSYFSDLASGVISGFGAIGYELAMQAALDQLSNS